VKGVGPVPLVEVGECGGLQYACLLRATSRCSLHGPSATCILEVASQTLENAGLQLGDLKGPKPPYCLRNSPQASTEYLTCYGYHTRQTHILGDNSSMLTDSISYVLDLRDLPVVQDKGCISGFILRLRVGLHSPWIRPRSFSWMSTAWWVELPRFR
jgi:hypothetical protein